MDFYLTLHRQIANFIFIFILTDNGYIHPKNAVNQIIKKTWPNVCLLIVYDILYISWYGMYCYKSESLWKINILACQSFTVCPYSLHTTDNSDTHCSDPWDVEHKLNYAMWEMVTRTLKSIHVCPTWQGSLKHLLKSKKKVTQCFT